MTDSELKNTLKRAKEELERLCSRHSGNLKSSYLAEPLDSVSAAIRELELREAEEVTRQAWEAACN